MNDKEEHLDKASDENDKDFEQWYEKFNNLSNDEKSQLIFNKIKEQISDVDKEVLDKIILLLKENQDKHTDLIWLQETLEKDYPDINPITITNYFLILNLCGIITLDNK